MNAIVEVSRLNDRELELGLSDAASWHAQYAHSAYIFVAGLDARLTEGDVICMLSQFGEVVDLHLVRDAATSASRGFGFAAFEDARSAVLAIDNLNGAKLFGRTLRVDHADRYRRPRTEDERRALQSRHATDADFHQFAAEGDAQYRERRKQIWDFEKYTASPAVTSARGGLSSNCARTGHTTLVGPASTKDSASDASEDADAVRVSAMLKLQRERKERMTREAAAEANKGKATARDRGHR